MGICTKIIGFFVLYFIPICAGGLLVYSTLSAEPIAVVAAPAGGRASVAITITEATLKSPAPAADPAGVGIFQKKNLKKKISFYKNQGDVNGQDQSNNHNPLPKDHICIKAKSEVDQVNANGILAKEILLAQRSSCWSSG